MKILFLDSINCIKRLLDIELIEKVHDIDFLGERFYGKEAEYFKKFDLIVQTHFTNITHQEIVLISKQQKVATMFIFDGVFDWANTYLNIKHLKSNLFIGNPFIHDYVLTVTGGVGLSFLKYTNPQTRFLQYIPKRNTSSSPNKGNNMTKCNAVLITTANTAYFNNSEFESLVRVIKLATKACEKKGITIKYRIFDSSLIKELGISNFDNLIEGTFETSLESVDFVISTSSTINVDVIKNALPLATLLYRNSPLFNSGGWLIYDEKTAEDSIENLVNKADDYHERILYQNSCYVTEKVPLYDMKLDAFRNEFYQKSFESLLFKLRTYTGKSHFKFLVSQILNFLKRRA